MAENRKILFGIEISRSDYDKAVQMILDLKKLTSQNIMTVDSKALQAELLKLQKELCRIWQRLSPQRSSGSLRRRSRLSSSRQ